jgi:hypothetical protein
MEEEEYSENGNIDTYSSNDITSSPMHSINSNNNTSNETHSNTPTSSRAFGRWFSVESNDKGNIIPTIFLLIIGNTPVTTPTKGPATTPIVVAKQQVEQVQQVPVISSIHSNTTLPIPYMDPAAESESASFITSLLSKATLQERNSNNNYSQMPPKNITPSNLPMHLPHHHLPHHMMQPSPQGPNQLPINPYLAHAQVIYTHIVLFIDTII